MISNSIYTHPICSCVFCKEIKTARGIYTHYKAHHGTEEERKKQCSGLGHGSYGITKQVLDKLARIESYQQNPTKCKFCNNPLDYEKRTNKFCSSSCAAKFNNPRKAPRSEESRNKTSIAKKKQTDNNLKTKDLYCKVSFCVICGSVIKHNNTRKTCSVDCKRKHLSEITSKRLSNQSFRQQHQYGRQKISYLEESFIKWLDNHNVYYLHEPSFKNWELNKTYFPDFYFPKLKLIIELDGTQHRKTIEQDQQRDAYIKQTYNITVVRITHHEYIKKLKFNDICKMLGV